MLTLNHHIQSGHFTADEKQVIPSVLQRKWEDIRKEVNNFKDISNDDDSVLIIDILNKRMNDLLANKNIVIWEFFRTLFSKETCDHFEENDLFTTFCFITTQNYNI